MVVTWWIVFLCSMRTEILYHDRIIRPGCKTIPRAISQINVEFCHFCQMYFTGIISCQATHKELEALYVLINRDFISAIHKEEDIFHSICDRVFGWLMIITCSSINIVPSVLNQQARRISTMFV